MTSASPAPTPSPPPGSPSDPAAATELPDAVARVAASVVGVVTRRSVAAGAVWRPGLVVTSASALWRAGRVQLVLPGGEAVPATLRGSDPGTDLAVLGFSDADRPAAAAVATVANLTTANAAGATRVGDFVFAVGREPEGTVHASFGHVGAVAGAWRSWRGGEVDRLIRLDGGLYPGLAGAPVALVEPASRGAAVIGIASQAFSRHHAMVLPASTIERILATLLEHGRVPRSHLGIAVQPVRAMLDGAATEGLLVSSVADGGPAALGSLLVGDVIVEAGGQPMREPGQLRAALLAVPPGNPFTLTVSRAGQRVALSITVAEQPAPGCC